jgi:hypothetical protein
VYVLPDGDVSERTTSLPGHSMMIETSSRPPLAVNRKITVTDNEGLTDFVGMSTVPMDVKPGSEEYPANVGASGKLPIALLSSGALDATKIDTTTLRLGPNASRPVEHGVHEEDVNGDGRLDLMMQFMSQDVGLQSGMTSLCMRGVLPDARAFTSCDRIRSF